MYKIPANSLFIGKVIDFVPSCHSTNTFALEKVKKNDIIDGLIVITDNQESGQGQRGNSWEAQPGKNLTFSLVLKSAFLPIHHRFFLNIITSLAVYQVLDKYGFHNQVVKWPNDILVNKKKVCGILIHNTIHNQNLDWSVIGVGLNVNQVDFEVEEAVSMAAEMNRNYSLEEVFTGFVQAFEGLYLMLKGGKLAALKERYYEVLYRLNEPALFKNNKQSEIFKGTILGIEPDGMLKVALPNGTNEVFDVKEISYL